MASLSNGKSIHGFTSSGFNNRSFCIFCLLLFFLLPLFQPDGAAQRGDEFVRLLAPLVGRPRLSVGSEFNVYPSASVRGTNDHFRYTQAVLTGQIPVAGSQTSLWQIGWHLESLELDTESALPRYPVTPVPDQLYDLEVNTTYRQLLSGNWFWGVTASVASASDRPFNSMDETNFGLTSVLRIPNEHNHAWLLFLNYSSQRHSIGLDHVPLPGVAYQWILEDGNWLMLGIPASGARINLYRDFRMELFYIFIRNVQVKLTCSRLESMDFYTTFNWQSQTFRRHDREKADEAFNLHHNKLALGTRYRFGESFLIGLESGVIFNRSIYEEKKYSSRHDNLLDIEPGWFYALTFGGDF